LYASYKKPTEIFGNVRCPILGKPSTPQWRLAEWHGEKQTWIGNWK